MGTATAGFVVATPFALPLLVGLVLGYRLGGRFGWLIVLGSAIGVGLIYAWILRDLSHARRVYVPLEVVAETGPDLVREALFHEQLSAFLCLMSTVLFSSLTAAIILIRRWLHMRAVARFERIR